nr:DUF2807 domain-containing protein [Bacteroidota bacterium]
MKNPLIAFVLSFLSIITFSSCNDCIRGEGDPVVQVIDIPEFSAIHVSGSTGIKLSQGNEQRVEITAPANIIAILKRSVRNNTWEVDFEECVRAKNIQINVIVPSISSIIVSGSGDVIGLNNLNVENLEINVMGSG